MSGVIANPVLAMGTFDGVHLGHRKLLTTCVDRARAINGEPVVLTYYHHPLETLNALTYPYLLTERSRKEELIRELGIEQIIYLRFDTEMAAMEPRAFLEDVIINGFHPREIVVGYDTHFGRHRQGNFPFLQSHEADYGYTTRFVEPVMVEDVIVSSSRIRDFVRQGAVDRVPALMGRPYSMLGKVESGAHIGHKLGFPTINLRPLDPHKLLPANGVYVSCARVDGADYVSVTNVGYSPTVKSEHPLEVETHLLDFSGDLYGHEVELVFTERIRDEVRFHNRATLSEAIAADVRFARSRYHA